MFSQRHNQLFFYDLCLVGGNPKNENCGLRFNCQGGRISKKGPEVLLKKDSKVVI